MMRDVDGEEDFRWGTESGDRIETLSLIPEMLVET
jgi:hypothetical protein